MISETPILSRPCNVSARTAIIHSVEYTRKQYNCNINIKPIQYGSRKKGKILHSQKLPVIFLYRMLNYSAFVAMVSS